MAIGGCPRSLLPLASSLLHGCPRECSLKSVFFQSGPIFTNLLSALLSGDWCILSKAPLRCIPRVYVLLVLLGPSREGTDSRSTERMTT